MTETNAAASTDPASSSTAPVSGSGSTDAGANAAAAATGAANGAAAAAGDSTTAVDSTIGESAPSLLSSAQGKAPPSKEGEAAKPETPAPAAEPKPDAKAADSAPKAEPAKPDDPGKAEAKADAATDPAKDATAIAPPAPVSLEDFKLPEGVKLAGESAKTFLELLNKSDLSKKDLGQGTLDLYLSEMTRAAQEQDKYQRKVWDNLITGWKSDLRKDPELGGNRLDTSLSMAKAVVEEFLDPEAAARLFQHTDDNGNGMGNFPDFIRLLHNIGRKMNVFEDGIIRSNPSAKPTGKTPGNRGWYDNSLNART